MAWVMTRGQNGILRSFLRRHLAGKTAVASRNVDCFLKLSSPEIAYFFYFLLFQVGPDLKPQKKAVS